MLTVNQDIMQGSAQDWTYLTGRFQSNEQWPLFIGLKSTCEVCPVLSRSLHDVLVLQSA